METNAAVETPVQYAPLTTTREERGREIARRGGIKKLGARFFVPSQSARSDAPTYLVDIIDQTCTCPDHELHGAATGERCKHQEAVWF